MGLIKALLLILFVVLGGAVLLGLWASARDARASERVWNELRGLPDQPVARYDPAMVVGLPEIAQRYFSASIAEGTPLHQSAEIRMEGVFLMNGRSFPMRAEQILASPHGFVWRARMGAGVLRFGGSDGYLAGRTSWTRFWLLGLAPLARTGDTPDHARAAAARMVMESIWTPAALLPQNGAVWRAVDDNRGEVSFPHVPGVEPVVMTLDPQGRVTEIVTQRWTDANPDRAFRLQPFGGRMLAHAWHDGFGVPVEVEIGNLFGTPDYAPFFRATLTDIHF